MYVFNTLVINREHSQGMDSSLNATIELKQVDK